MNLTVHRTLSGDQHNTAIADSANDKGCDDKNHVGYTMTFLLPLPMVVLMDRDCNLSSRLTM
jgi:hypothetical protein